MSFTYAGQNSDALAGVTATLTTWPSLGGLGVETSQVPGHDGVVFYGSSLESTDFEFDVLVQGATPAQCAQRRDLFIAAVDPSRGPRDLLVEPDTAWVWRDVLVASAVDWSRMVWERGLGFVLRSTVTFQTVGDPAARQVTPAVVDVSGATSVTLTLGNTSTHPRITFASGAATKVVIGSFSVDVAATPAGSTVVLDYEAMDFYLANTAGARTASAVRHMSHYDRPQLALGQTVTVNVTRGGNPLAAKFYPNARRI
ncbi:MAG: hypothetical protein ACTII7_07815 [Galactobacter sp.]